MEWINEALRVSELDIDDLFEFDRNGFVTSRCTDSPDADLLIHNNGCDHSLGGDCLYETWKRQMMHRYNAQANWDKPLNEEAFFRAHDQIPGGQVLMDRMRTRKDERAQKFRGHRR